MVSDLEMNECLMLNRLILSSCSQIPINFPFVHLTKTGQRAEASSVDRTPLTAFSLYRFLFILKQ